MTLGEQLYLGLVLFAFFTFGIVLATISTTTNRYSRRKAKTETGEQARSDVREAA